MFGDKQWFNDQGGYPTPTEIPEATASRTFCIPGSTAWLAVIMGCLMQLADEANWQVFDGGISAEDAAEAAQIIIDSGYDGTCAASTNTPTPYWDDATDVDDESDPATQVWYGYVDDAEAAREELTFFEDAAIWTFTGFLAVTGTPAAAILFNTIAPSFVLAMRGDDFGEVIRVLIDGQEQARVDTTGLAGEVIRVPIAPDPDVSPHEVLLIKVE